MDISFHSVDRIDVGETKMHVNPETGKPFATRRLRIRFFDIFGHERLQVIGLFGDDAAALAMPGDEALPVPAAHQPAE